MKSHYQCSSCEHQSIKWLGCCPSCNAWNSLHEIKTTSKIKNVQAASLIPLTKISSHETKRFLSGIDEWDRVMGGGIMPGSFMILTGDPGIGKSTLLLQIAYKLAHEYNVLYFSSEESLVQVKGRADRLGYIHEKLLFADQANLDEIIVTAQQYKPDLIIIDSIQNCFTPETNTLPGSISQLRESAFKLMRLAKEKTISIMLTGHITKEGQIAGPRTLEHMVDAVFYLQGEDRWQARVLRSVKNRFGTINELGFFEMGEQGMTQVPNINKYLLEDMSFAPGSALISYIEGTRPLLIELQALTIATKFSVPQRVISGIDQKQVILIAAILEKYLQIKLSTHDLFFKISGSFKIKASSADLGIALALLSSYFQKPLPEKSIALGEISLTGHIKPINSVNLHMNEADKFGIQTIMLSAKQKQEKKHAKFLFFKHVYELLTLFDV